MTFADEIAKPRSERYPLVRITPRRNVTASLAAEGGGIYGMTFSYDIAKVERNGTVLTEDASAPTVNDHWYVNPTTGAFDVKLASAPNATTNIVVIFYNLYFTTGEYRTAYQTPTDSATTEQSWEPRISSDVTFKQSAKDMLNGVSSSSLSDITLSNTDQFITAYLTSSDSFCNAETDVWFSVNGTLQKIFKGYVRDIDIDLEKVSLTFSDFFSKMTGKFLAGDPPTKAYYLDESDSFPNIATGSANVPIPFVMARKTRSYCQANDGFLNINSFSTFEDGLREPVNTNYSATVSTTTNRSWGICRFPSTGPGTQVLGTVTAVTTVDNGSNYMTIHVKLAATTYNLMFGDSFKITEGANTVYGWVSAIPDPYDDGINGPFYYDVQITAKYSGGAAPAITTAMTVHLHNGPAIFIKDSDDLCYVLIYERDYSRTNTTLDSGNIFQSITLTNNFEANLTSIGFSATFDPSSMSIRYRARMADADCTVGDAIHYILDAHDLTFNTTSRSALDTSLTLGSLEQISHLVAPTYAESDFDTGLAYLQKLMSSVFGWLTYDYNTDEVIAGLFDTPSAGDEITEADYDDLAVDVSYEDIADSVKFTNPETRDMNDGVDSSIAAIITAVPKYLHQEKRDEIFEHWLYRCGRRVDIAAFKANRQAVYTFKTATKLLDANIGDDITLTSDLVLGGSGSVNLKIISLEKSIDGVTVEATDLLGV